LLEYVFVVIDTGKPDVVLSEISPKRVAGLLQAFKVERMPGLVIREK